MITIKSYTDREQSKKLAEILSLESADMVWEYQKDRFVGEPDYLNYPQFGHVIDKRDIPCWSLAALYAILPEINGVSFKIEKVKAEDGYNGYYYPIEYEGIVLIPYPKNPVDACYEMILKLNELKML